MSYRPVFSGHLVLGLLSVPIKAFSAFNNAENLEFNQLHAPCGQRVKQKLVCEPCQADDLKRGSADILKGYEFAKGRYVSFTHAEIDAFKVESSQTIRLTNFVDADSIDPLMLNNAFFLGPDTKSGFGKHAFATLREALGDRVGIGKVAMYGREHLVAMRQRTEMVEDREVKGLLVQTLLRPSELRSIGEIESLDYVGTNPDEVAMAEALIVQMTKPFDFASFKDEYVEGLKKMIDAKVQGQPFQAPVVQQAPAATNVMDALKASLAAASSAPAVVTIPSVPDTAAPRRAFHQGVAVGKKTAAKASLPKGRRRVSA